MVAGPQERLPDSKLRILHVFRAPVGGLFRHVIDLAHEQIARGHAVGLVTDSTTGGDRAAEALGQLEPLLELGLLRMPMHRQPHLSDFTNAVRIANYSRGLKADVVHGHGSKGGLYARLPGLIPGYKGVVRAYTPHGGSFHYRTRAITNAVFMGVERLLSCVTDIFLFESNYIGDCFREKVGEPRRLVRFVVNGLKPSEFAPIEHDSDAAEFLYVGELRAIKGIDTLIDALALLVDRRAAIQAALPRLVLVGSGPEAQKLADYAASNNLGHLICFAGALPARKAFERGRILVVPSRAESLPYIVLEASAARMPIIATDVGGINEIFGPYRKRLITCGDPAVLAATLERALQRPEGELDSEAELLSEFVATKFTIDAMAEAVLAGYAEALARKYPHRGTASASIVLPSQ
ncbi:MAG: glycosyltransferase family 1 protein [Beijerinckiaceae bacterium]|nr:MAG: glycosyltransferase family 1 protein [Beijerinckiaceae bacterium]